MPKRRQNKEQAAEQDSGRQTPQIAAERDQKACAIVHARAWQTYQSMAAACIKADDNGERVYLE